MRGSITKRHGGLELVSWQRTANRVIRDEFDDR